MRNLYKRELEYLLPLIYVRMMRARKPERKEMLQILFKELDEQLSLTKAVNDEIRLTGGK